MRDEVYANAQPHLVDFAFSAEVAAVFPDMIRRSVPGYETVVPMTGLLAARHLKDHDMAVDLGCSLGATCQAILSQNPAPNVTVIGIDSSAPMIEGAREINTDPRATFIEGDFTSAQHAAQIFGARVITLNFVLQFLPPEQRSEVMQNLYQALAPGGMLLLSEKVQNPDPSWQEFYDSNHLAWKRANGYSELEVSQKRAALENVMRVDSEDNHTLRLTAVGFERVQQWYKCMNWASFVAFKPEA